MPFLFAVIFSSSSSSSLKNQPKLCCITINYLAADKQVHVKMIIAQSCFYYHLWLLLYLWLRIIIIFNIIMMLLVLADKCYKAIVILIITVTMVAIVFYVYELDYYWLKLDRAIGIVVVCCCLLLQQQVISHKSSL